MPSSLCSSLVVLAASPPSVGVHRDQLISDVQTRYPNISVEKVQQSIDTLMEQVRQRRTDSRRRSAITHTVTLLLSPVPLVSSLCVCVPQSSIADWTTPHVYILTNPAAATGIDHNDELMAH